MTKLKIVLRNLVLLVEGKNELVTDCTGYPSSCLTVLFT